MSPLSLSLSAHINIEICGDRARPRPGRPGWRRENTGRHFFRVWTFQTFETLIEMFTEGFLLVVRYYGGFSLVDVKYQTLIEIHSLVRCEHAALPLSVVPKWERSEVIWWNDIPDFSQCFESQEPWEMGPETWWTVSLVVISHWWGSVTVSLSHWWRSLTPELSLVENSPGDNTRILS